MPEQVSSACPGWDASPLVEAWPGLPTLDETRKADACVIGLGGSGLAAIEELLDRGRSVIGLDSGRVAAGAAGRNGGFLIGGAAQPLSHDGTVSSESKIELWRRTLAELDHLHDQLGGKIIRRCPWINIAGMIGGPRSAEEERWEAEELAALSGEPAALQSIGIAAEAYAGPLGRGFVVADQARVNPAERAFALASILRDRGAQLYEQSPVAELRPGQVRTATGVVEAPVIIVAIDGGLELLLSQLAPVVTTYRLQMISTDPLAPVLPDAAVSARFGYEWMQQDATGRLFIGGGRDRFLQTERTPSAEPSEGVQSWIEAVAERVAGGTISVRHRWAAPVGYTDDHRALCIPIAEGIVAVGGYCGHGNLVGPVAARTAVAHACDGAPIGDHFRSTLA